MYVRFSIFTHVYRTRLILKVSDKWIDRELDRWEGRIHTHTLAMSTQAVDYVSSRHKLVLNDCAVPAIAAQYCRRMVFF